MRRTLPVIITFTLFALLAWSMSGELSPPGLLESEQVSAQTGPDLPILEATIFGETFKYRTLPGAQVLVELSNAAGEVKGSSAALADDTGLARIAFGAYFLGSGDIAIISIGGAPTVLEPGDLLRILQVGAPTREIVIPNLTADVDVARDLIEGTGPAGAALAVSFLGQRYEVTAGADGHWQVSPAGGGDDPVPQGSFPGSVSYLSPENLSFTSYFDDLGAQILLGAQEIAGSATAGTAIGLLVETADGRSLDYAPTQAINMGIWSILMGADPFAPMGPGPRPPEHRVGAGDRLTLSQTGGPMGANRSYGTTVPEMSIALDPESGMVSGSGPANTELFVSGQSLYDQNFAPPGTTSDADGRFSMDLSSWADLGPGWQVQALWKLEPEITVGLSEVIPGIDAGVDVARLSGMTEPGRQVTVTLSTSSGNLKSRQVTVAGSNGRFGVQHRPGAPGGGLVIGGNVVPAEQGDRLEIELQAGDPVVLTVPELAAVTDAVSDTIKGTAPAGARIVARVQMASGGFREVETVADDQGSYTADVSAFHDIAPGSFGRVTAFDSRGYSFFTPWAAPRMSIQVGESAIGGLAAAGKRVEAVLLAPGGIPVAQAEGTAFDFAGSPAGRGDDPELQSLDGRFFLEFLDVAGEGVPVRPGDTVRVYSGDEQAEVLVPPLDGVVFVESDLVTGRSEAGREVAIQAVPFGGGLRSVTVTADENGAFSHEFKGDPDLRYNDVVGLSIAVDGHAVGRTITIPGLTLDLDSSTLSGTIWLRTRYRLEARRGGNLLASSDGVSAPDGLFSAQLLEANGDPFPLREGDQLSVIQITRQAGQPLEMTVPELTIAADVASDQVAGLATPGGRLVVLARDAGQAFSLSQSWPEIGRDGAWTADFIPAWDVAPGTAIAAQYRLAEGHVALRTHYVPLLRAEIDGPNACGFTTPHGTVTAWLRDAGSSLASARTTGRYDGRFQAVLRSPGGVLAASGGGQNVGADLAGSVVNLILPELDLEIDWLNQTLSGTGPAETFFSIGMPATRCLEGAGFGDTFALRMRGRSDAGGSIQAQLPLPLQPGEGFEIGFTDTAGHQTYKQYYRTLGQVYIDTPRVTGITNSNQGLSMKLVAPDLSSKGIGLTIADENGDFDTGFLDGAHDPVASEADDTVEIYIDGRAVARILVEPLDFDWSQGAPIVGTAKPSREVLLQLKLADDRILRIPRVTSGNGLWGFGADEVPPRATWSLADVEAVRATIENLDGHQIIFQTPNFEPDDPAPRPEPTAVFLPWLGNDVVTRAAIERAPAQGPSDTAAPRWISVPAPVSDLRRQSLRLEQAGRRIEIPQP